MFLDFSAIIQYIIHIMVSRQSQSPLDVLKSFSEFYQLDICFHDGLHLAQLPRSWRRHIAKACETFRASPNHNSRCINFDGHEMRAMLFENPSARLVVCPAGYRQIVAGVCCGGAFAGVIFIGPFSMDSEETPNETLPQINADALPAMLIVADALAGHLGRVLWDASEAIHDRHRKILHFIQANLARKISLADLAQSLSLSPSRAGHVVRQCCGMTFPELINQLRLQEATRLLVSSESSIQAIAALVGYEDQNYFSRNFKKRYGLSPRAYRNKHFMGI